jgi:hypothetical protein
MAKGRMNMKHKVTVITDTNGKFLGAVRTGSIQDGQNTLHFHAVPHPNQKHHEVEVDEEVMRQPFDQVRQTLVSKLSGKQ